MGQIDSLSETYDLKEEDVKRLNIINDETRKIKDSYNNLMDCSKNHTFPYSISFFVQQSQPSNMQ